MILLRITGWFDTSTSIRLRIWSSERLPGGDAPEENWQLSWHPVRTATDRKPSFSTPAAAQLYIWRVQRYRPAASMLSDSSRDSRPEVTKYVYSEHQHKRGLSLPQHLETSERFQQSRYGKLTFYKYFHYIFGLKLSSNGRYCQFVSAMQTSLI